MSATRPTEQTPAPNSEDDLVQYTLAGYDVGHLLRYWPAAQGIENRNYFVQTGDGEHSLKYVLTFVDKPSNAGAAYFEMMQALKDDGLPVAAPLSNRQQQLHTAVGDGYALLQPCLTGTHTINPTQKQIRALARFVARMHLTLHKRRVDLPAYPRDALWLAATTEQLAPNISFLDRTLMQQALSQTTSLLSRHDVQHLPMGAIHGDLFRDNVLFNEHGLTGVLDFHHASHGYWIYDLAVIANDWCNDAHGRLDPDRTVALLKAYHQVRPLTQQEVWFFPMFALYAAMSFWQSRSVQAIAHLSDTQIRFKDPQEFRRIVAHHLSHALYLDVRKLDA
ncbi:MAG: homoserine kinase [Pseudomonadota bacterium]